LYSACVPIQNQATIFAFTNAEGAMVIADSDDTDAISSFLEFQRRMKGVALPE
jgi:hypothetical protein